MKRTALSFLLCSTLLSLSGCCQSGMKCNQWTEKDCYYSDYYATPPPAVPTPYAYPSKQP